MEAAIDGSHFHREVGIDEQTAWREYLAFVQASRGEEYAAAEELAWGRLMRTLDELSVLRAQRELADALDSYG